MAWHLGSALSQTLFANLYIDKLMATNPARVVDATFGGAPSGESAELLEIVLRPYCIAVVKGAWYANYQITSEHIIEEEDFVSQTYGVMMLMHAPKEEVVGLLDAALEWLVERENEFKDGVYVALRNRLLLRRGLLDDLAADAGSYHGGSEGGWDKTLELLGELEKDHVLGKPVPEAWSMSVQRKLASSVPPRPPVEITFAEAATTLRQMCLQTKDLLKILEYKGATEVLVSLCLLPGGGGVADLGWVRRILYTLERRRRCRSRTPAPSSRAC